MSRVCSTVWQLLRLSALGSEMYNLFDDKWKTDHINHYKELQMSAVAESVSKSKGLCNALLTNRAKHKVGADT